MAIVTAYVRAPISGHITGRDQYCKPLSQGGDACNGSQGAHGKCMSSSNPVDIGGTGSLYLRVNYPNVRSIVTFISLNCCSTTIGNDYRRMVTVELYGQLNAGCYMGAVRFGHVASPAVTNGTTYNLTSSSKLIGTVPSGSAGGCYTGAHSHMERVSGSVVAPCCGATVTTSTNIYKFTWDNTITCDNTLVVR